MAGKDTGLRYQGARPRLVASFCCAFRGLAEAWCSQPNLRIHGLFVLIISGLAAYLGLDPAQWAILVLTFGVVLAEELLNSALEALADLASPGYHPLARRAKDVAAGAVVVTALASIVIGLLILGPPLWDRLARMPGWWQV